MTKLFAHSHQLAISSQANPAQPALSAQRGRRQNPFSLRGANALREARASISCGGKL